MLFVREREDWEPLEPEGVVRRMLAGRLRADTPARVDRAAAGDGVLLDALTVEHFRALSRLLLEAVAAIYAGALDGPSLAELEARVEELARWEFPMPRGRRVRLRLAWLSAWLAELMGRDREAMARYGAFLGLGPDALEPGLAQIARNNRAVLGLRAGQFEAAPDLARAALVEGLAGACFSLLNLIAAAVADGTLAALGPIVLRAVAESGRPDWFGPVPEPAPTPAEAEADSDAEPAVGPERSLDEPGVLEHLVRELAARALGIEPAERVEDDLRFWSPAPEVLVAGPPSWPPAGSGAACPGEAVTLLYRRDIPEGLGAEEPSPSPVEALAEEHIARARDCLDRREYGRVAEVLAPVDALLRDRRETPRSRALRVEVGRLRDEAARLVLRREAAEFRRRLEALAEEVDAICRDVGDPTEAGKRRLLLVDRLRALKGLQAASLGPTPAADADLAAALALRLDEHIGRLEARARAERLAGPQAALFALWPSDLAAPTPTEAYEQLKLCRLADPDRTAHDWDAIEHALDRHNARHYFAAACRRAGDPAERDRAAIEELLRRALTWDAGLAPSAAPLIALLYLPAGHGHAETLDGVRAELIAAAQRLVGDRVLDPDPLVPPGLRGEVVADAIRCLKRVGDLLLREQDLQAVRDLTRGLWQTFRPVLRRGGPAQIEAVAEILRRWRSVCRDWFDPRHPYRAALEDVEVSGRLARAEELLRESDGATADADREPAKALVAEALRHAPADAEQAVAAVRLYALTRPLAGPKSRQARVLDALEARVGRMSWPDPDREALDPAEIEGWIAEAEGPSPRGDAPGTAAGAHPPDGGLLGGADPG